MKYFESSAIFHYSWEQVAQGLWRRYPNSFSSHVLSEDTISREVKDGKLYSKRLLKKTSGVPKWGERFAGSLTAFIIEESIVDPKSKVIITYTRNIYKRALNIVEKVVYEKSQDNGNWTIANRSAWIDSPVRGFSRAIISFGFHRFKSNCQKAVDGFNQVLGKMFPDANDDSSTIPIATKADKIKDAAKIASDLARSKAPVVFASDSCQEDRT